MNILVAALIAVILALSIVVVILWRQTRRVSLGLDEITEDVLKTLYHLSRQQPLVRSRDLISRGRSAAGALWVDRIRVAPPRLGASRRRSAACLTRRRKRARCN